MQEIVKGLVSIIIPYYKARGFIAETINSILTQTYQDFEIILVNDGSNENDLENFLFANFPKVIFIDKTKNTGVSDTRNTGFKTARGEFIVFLDADDILTTNFLRTRVDALSNNECYDFCSGNVNLFKNKDDIKTDFWNNNTSNLLKDILLFNPNINTCPSNFMFKNVFLLTHKLKFNSALQSTADRYFLAEVLYNKGSYTSVSEPNSQLIYRVHSDSMSNTLSKGLVTDNLTYYLAIKKNDYVPHEFLNEFDFKMRFILCGAYKQIKEWKGFIRFSLILLLNHPKNLVLGLLKKRGVI